MRVIAGDLRGRQINAVKGDSTRPTTDKVKENVFNILGQFFDGGCALDLFAGSGNLGIEALSRGIDHAIFIDMNLNAIKTIKENIQNLKLEERTEIYRNDAFRALNVLAKKGAQFDLIFLDPPYGKISITELLEIIVDKKLLNFGGQIVCENGAGLSAQYDVRSFKEVRRAVYGTIEILIIEKVAD